MLKMFLAQLYLVICFLEKKMVSVAKPPSRQAAKPLSRITDHGSRIDFVLFPWIRIGSSCSPRAASSSAA